MVFIPHRRSTMLNLGTYCHMTHERYQRYLDLLDRLQYLEEDHLLPIRRIYLLLDERDREPGPRQALIGRLKRDGILRRDSALPVRYKLRKNAIPEAIATIRDTLNWHSAQYEQEPRHLQSINS
jgi:hypothetical protein